MVYKLNLRRIVSAVVLVAIAVTGVFVYSKSAETAWPSSGRYTQGRVGPPPVAWWPLDNSTTTIYTSTNDVSGNGNTCTFPAGNVPILGLLGQIHEAFGFDGAGVASGTATASVINCGTGSTLSITGNFSMSAWVILNHFGATSNGQEIVGGGYDGTNTAYEMQVTTTGKMQCDTFRGGATHGVTSASLVSKLVFQFWACTFDGSTWRIYLNGVLDNSNADTNGPIVTATRKTIGALWRDDTSVYFLFCGCVIDDVRLFNVVLTPLQITQIYNSAGPQVPKLATFSAPVLWNTTPTVKSDSYDTTWADDDKIYTTHNDFTNDWSGTGLGSGNNIALSTVSTYTPSLTGTVVNHMASWGTGEQLGSDGNSYKSRGLISISGTLYWFVTRDNFVFNTPQPVAAAQLIKSTDHGVTWTPTPPSTAQQYASPMFSGGPGLHTFTSPKFIQYGKDYQGQTADNSGTYVYAISNDGYYNIGSAEYLGRVKISNIGNLSASDWTFYQGGDGSLDANWGPISTAASLISDSTYHRLGSPGGIQYVGTTYVQWTWYYPTLSAGLSENPSTSGWRLWTAPHPWGPWTAKQDEIWATVTGNGDPMGLYEGLIVPKSVSGCTFTTFSASDFNISYTLFITAMTLSSC